MISSSYYDFFSLASKCGLSLYFMSSSVQTLDRRVEKLDRSGNPTGSNPAGGHRDLRNTLFYISLESALFQNLNKEFYVKVADSIDKACKLLEVSFDISPT